MTTGELRKRWQSAITEVEKNRLRTYGIDQREIIRRFSYEEMVFLLLFGRRPAPREANLLRAVIVSHISHGITGQSTLSVMQAADCRTDFLHALIGGFSVGAGPYHQGCLTESMRELKQMAELTPKAMGSEVEQRCADKYRIPGFGHRFHTKDPRAETLLEIAEEAGFSGPHIDTARTIDAQLQRLKGVAINIDGAGGAILLDLGLDPEVAHLIIVIGRSPMFAAAYAERLNQGRPPFQRIEVVDVMEEVKND